MLTAYSRVTVVTAERKVDLALPSALPVSDVVPQVMRYCAPDGAETQPTAWTLARIGGQPLALNQTLTDAGVLDGDVLELREQHDDLQSAMVEDVRDAIEDSADSAGGVWSPTTTVTFVVLVGAVVLLVAAIPVLLSMTTTSRPFDLGRFDSPSQEIVSAVAVVAVLVGAAAWSARAAHQWVAQVCVAVAMGWGVLIGMSLGDLGELDRWVTVILAVISVAAIAAVARLITPAASGHLATGVTVAAAGTIAAIVGLSSVPTPQSHRILPVLCLLVTGVVPRLSLSVGGLASADYRVRHVGGLSLERLRARYRQSNAILIGTLVGLSLVIVWGGYYLTFSADAWDRYLGLSIAAAALLRSRVFSRIQHMVPLRVAGVIVFGLQLVRVADDNGGELVPWLVLIVAAIFAAAVAIGSLQMSEITRARVKRTLNIVEFLVVVDVVVLLLGATGLYATLGRIAP